MESFKDLWNFVLERKKFWLAPIILIILFMAVILIFAESSAIGSFVYTLF
ncbi:MAG: DUF5989 family protein [Bacteroidia bacterium]|nr:DUF5989 family protein [Bacteroidia bacterium]